MKSIDILKYSYFYYLIGVNLQLMLLHRKDYVTLKGRTSFLLDISGLEFC